jgi:hypothetical protein
MIVIFIIIIIILMQVLKDREICRPTLENECDCIGLIVTREHLCIMRKDGLKIRMAVRERV